MCPNNSQNKFKVHFDLREFSSFYLDIFVSFLANLFKSSQTSKSKVLLHAVGPEEEGGGEVLCLGDVTGNVCALDNALLSGHTLQE